MLATGSTTKHTGEYFSIKGTSNVLLVFTRFTNKNIPTNFNIIHHFRECMMHKLSLDFVKRSGIYISSSRQVYF